MGGAGFGGGVFFEEVADFEVEVWEVGGAAEPEILEQKLPNTFILLVYVLDKKKKVAKISLDDQILLFIVQREAIVDITGTL